MITNDREANVTLELDIQLAEEKVPVPGAERLNRWCCVTLGERCAESPELTIRVVGEEESGRLNQRYRGKCGATNVLSFPVELPDFVDSRLMGDLVICSPVVAREASEQGKTPDEHWAHIVVHGVLHLLGYDHETESDAQRMEQREREILDGLGFPDPYRTP